MASITLYTKVDTTGAVADTQKLTAQIKTALENGDVALARHTQAWLSASQAVEKHATSIDSLMLTYEQLQAVTQTPLYQNYQADLAKIEQLKATIADLEAQMAAGGNVTQLSLQINQLNVDLAQVQSSADAAAMALRKANGGDVDAQIESTTQKIIQEKEALQSLTNKAEIAKTALQQDNTIGQSVDSLSKKFGNLGATALRTMKRIALYATLGLLLRTVIKEMGAMLMSNEQFAQSIERLKASFYMLAVPIYETVLPILRVLIDTIAEIVSKIATFLYLIQGKSLSQLEQNSKSLRKNTAAYKESTKAKKKNAQAQKDLNKQVAAFDELMILQEKKQKGIDNTPSGGTALDTDGPDKDKEKYHSRLALVGMVTGAALVGLGIIMMFSGHIAKGIAMVAAGYVVSKAVAKGASSTLGTEETKKLAKIGTFTGVALIGIGCLLLFNAKTWKYGLGAIATGAMMVYQAYELGEFSQDVKSLVLKILLISGLVEFLLGVILLFVSGGTLWKYGLALMAAGVIQVISPMIFDPSGVHNALQEIISQYWEKIVGIAVMATVVGICLLFTPMWGFGLALIVSGIAALVTVYKFDGGDLKITIATFIAAYYPQIMAISAVAIVAGICLLFTPLWGCGLALIVGGIATVVTAQALSYGDVQREVTSAASDLSTALKALGAIAFIIGLILCFVPGCLGIGLALMAGGAASWFSGKTISMSSNALKESVKSGLNDVNSAAKSGVDKINKTLSGVKSSSMGEIKTPTFGSLTAPGYARGTVVPPNRPHLAWIGDNTRESEVVSPISTMKQAVQEAVLELGGSFGSGNTTVVLEVDGREFGRAVVEQGNRETRRIGTKLVVV